LNAEPFGISNRHRRQLVAALCLIAGVVAALVGYQIWSSHEEALRRAEVTTRNFAAILEARLDATLRRADADLLQLADSIPLEALTQDNVTRYARDIDRSLDLRLRNFPELSGLRIVDATGAWLYPSGGDAETRLKPQVGDREFFRKLRDDPKLHSLFSEVILARSTGRTIVAYARSLHDQRGAFRGVVIATINLNLFQDLFKSLDIGPNGIISIYRADNFTQVMRRPPTEGKLNVQLPPDSPTRRALPAGAHKATISLKSAADGMVRIYSYDVLTNYPFFISVGIAETDALAAWTTRSLLVGLGALALLALLALLLRRLLHAEAELKQRDAWFGAAFEQAALGMALRDINTQNPRWQRVNKKLCDMLGYTSDEMLQLTSLDITPPADRDLARRNNERLARGEVTQFSREKSYIRKDGTLIWVNLLVSVMLNDEGRPTHLMSIITDISAEKRAREDRAYLAAIISGSSDAIISRTLDRNISSWNPAAERMFGYSADEIIGQSVAVLIPPDYEAEAARSRALIPLGKPVTNVETVRLTKDGRRIDVSMSQSLIYDDHKNPLGVSVIFRDISDRKRGDELNAQLAAIVAGSNDAIVSFKREDRIITSWNAAAQRMFAYTAEEIIGQSGALLIPPDREQEASRNRELLAQGLPVIDLETVRLAKDGRRIDVSMTQSPIFDVRGNSTSVALMFRDITGRKRTENIVREGEQRMRLATETTGVGIWEWHLLTNRVKWDAQMFRIYGLTPTVDGLINFDDWRATLVPEETQRNIEILQDTVRRCGTSTREFRIRRADNGEERHIRAVETVRTDETGRAEWVVGTNLDFTETKRAENARIELETQLRESQKMEAIGTLAGGIAHDFNNIIATILANTELAQADKRAQPPTLESIAEIGKATARARDLVQQILSFSRRQSTELKPGTIAPIIDESARLLRATLPARIAIETHCAADLPQVLMDATQIQQVVLNIATNAMQAMKNNAGKIAIRADTVMLDRAMVDTHPELLVMHGKHTGRTVRITVSDDGPGMDAATCARIFEPFFTTKVVGEGTGLGLSVVLGIIQTHDGTISVASEPGHGATFTIYLPATAVQIPAAAPVQAIKPAQITGGGQHILYIDDEEPLLFITKRLLERRGFRMSGYTDAREGLAALRADPAAFDLVVTDYNMPGMSGLDVAREVRAIRADLPLAVASGFIDEELQTKAADAGVRELIFKANSMEDMCGAIARLAQNAPARAVQG
jgi:PAS domain S-box-containing protein